MGEPLSIAASIAGLINISAQVVGIAKELYDKVKDAPETMMRVREEVESMQPIFCQVHLLLNGSGSGLNRGNLTMISIYNLMATLTGCVIVYTRLEKKVNEVCGFSDPTSSWKRAGVVADRVKWGLWRHEEVLVIIGDLQRHKLSLNMMLTILTYTTTTEVAENQAKLLQDQTTELLQSNNAQSVLLRELISRQEEQASRQQEQARTLEILLAGSAGSTPPPTAGSHPSDYRGSSDNASIMSKRSTLSFRLGRPDYLEDLKESRAYKRLRHFGRGIDADSSSESVFSSDSSRSTGNWSMLSDITLGDLSVSQIAVLNLPIELSDVCNPEPFLEPSSTETRRNSRPRARRIWSSRGRIHNAIGNGNEFVVRTVLAMGMDIEEVDSNGRTPLIHAIMKHREAICNLLLEKGASVEPLKAFTTGMDLKERSELLDPLITRALNDVASSVYGAVLRSLVQMALGTNYGDDSRFSGRSMMNTAIDMDYDLAVHAIIHLEPQVLVEVDTEGRTPFAYAYHLQRNEICEILLQYSEMAIETATEVVKLEGDLSEHAHAAIDENCPQLLGLLLGMNVGTEEFIDVEGRTLLVHAAQLVLNSEIDGYESLEGVCRVLLDNTNLDIEAMKKIVMVRTAISMHELVKRDYKSILQLLSLIESRDAEGWTPLASTAFNNNEALCEFFVEKGCGLCLDTEQKSQLKPKLSCRIHAAAEGGHETALQLLLDMGADINERNSGGETALLEAVYYNHLSCVKILVKRGADATILTHYGESVLHRATWRLADSEMMKYLLDVVEIRKLVNIQSSYGKTPLHDCSYSDHHSPIVRLENAKIILQAGASLTIKSWSGQTPYEYARDRQRKELAKYLWSQLSPEQQAREKPPPSDW